MNANNLRIGHGYDVHKFSQQEPVDAELKLRLAGVDIPYNRRLLAHSDGDVVIHSLCDAILGALGAGDIGKLFPDSDARYKNIDSTELLNQVVARAQQDHWHLVNADMTVVAQAPKLAPFIDAMRDRLAACLLIDKTAVNVKATTSEGLGFTGRQEGIASYAVVLLGKSTS